MTDAAPSLLSPICKLPKSPSLAIFLPSTHPQTIHLFQKACRTGDYDTFKQFTQTVDNMGAEGVHLRSLLDFNYAADGGIPLEEVEPVSSIVKRFKGAAMSYGALSSEAHETIAIALNRLGGRSNTGEGGEPEGATTARAIPRSNRWLLPALA